LTISLSALVISSGGCGESTIPNAPSGSFPWWIPFESNRRLPPSDRETTVVIWGSNFKDGLAVMVDGIAAKVTLVGSTAMNVVFPAHAVGVVDIRVTNG
jgi:hypothetical protein